MQGEEDDETESTSDSYENINAADTDINKDGVPQAVDFNTESVSVAVTELSHRKLKVAITKLQLHPGNLGLDTPATFTRRSKPLRADLSPGVGLGTLTSPTRRMTKQKAYSAFVVLLQGKDDADRWIADWRRRDQAPKLHCSPGACIQGGGFYREKPRSFLPISVDIGIGVRLRDELTQRAETVSWGECGGVASEECSSGLMEGAVSFASRACSPGEVAAGICNEEGLRRRAEAEGHEVLARTGGRSIRILREF
ncbi:hypothetical protein OIU74_018324 [Salix koriyanagi]|uniref:Uncharacterized protein n=1 Tax=Salix koriyanagi TaxID=2511006 RepID=A0A9Q0WTX2_9ROSI|nr:hypothetical protein OIU74_018324 [Salix koriyanagi]